MPEQSKSMSDEISFREVIDQIRRGWVTVATVTLLLTAITAVATYLAPKRYEASVLLAPVRDDYGGQGGGALGSLVSQFGGIASIAGLSLGGSGRQFESMAFLESETLTEKYINDHDLLPVLFAKQWDNEARRWREGSKETPTVWQANRFFKRNVRKVTTDTKTGLVTLSIIWTDPVLAATWANGLVRLTNDYLRDKAIGETERNIAYLTTQASKTDVVKVQEAIYTILESEIKKAMLARGTQEYALKVIDPAVPPERPISPIPLVWILSGVFGGLFLSIIIVLTRK